jgi:molybdenum cofactor cytidylyltransferase
MNVSAASAGTPRFAALLLSAGRSQRMGAQKLMAPRAGQPMILHSLRPLLTLNLCRIVVVGSAESGVRNVLQDDVRVRYIENTEPGLGLSSSLRLGVETLVADADAVFIALADMPGISLRTYEQLREAWDGSSLALIPVHGGRRGHPVLLSSKAFEWIERIEGDRGLRDLLLAAGTAVREWPVKDAGVLFDIDTPEQLQAWQAG